MDSHHIRGILLRQKMNNNKCIWKRNVHHSSCSILAKHHLIHLLAHWQIFHVFPQSLWRNVFELPYIWSLMFPMSHPSNRYKKTVSNRKKEVSLKRKKKQWLCKYHRYDKFLTRVSHIKNDKKNDQHKNPYDIATVIANLSWN